MKAGDRDPPFTQTLTELVSGQVVPINLTGTTLTLTMVNALSRLVVFTNSASIVDPVNGIMQYQWGPTDTINPGNYLILIHITDLSTGFVRTYPDNNYITFTIDPNYS